MTAYEMYLENETDQGLREVFKRAEEKREKTSQSAALTAPLERGAEGCERIAELERKTEKLQARAQLLISAIEGICGGAALAAGLMHEWVSMAAMLGIGAALALGWGIIK